MKAINVVDVPSHGEWPNLMQISRGAMLALDLIDQCQAPMLLAEQHLTSGITQARLRELQAGRATARNAMHHLKQNAGPILTGPTGAPVWPDGYCGSLSHTTHHVAAIIALATRYDSVGVDIDDKRPLGSAVRDVATMAELEIVDAMRHSQPVRARYRNALITALNSVLRGRPVRALPGKSGSIKAHSWSLTSVG